MSLRLSSVQRRLGAITFGLVAVAAAFLLGLRFGRRSSVTVTEGKFPEELVYVRSTDDIVSGGAMFTASRAARKPLAVIWIHGWGANFYAPTYTVIARELAARGLTTIVGNTRMHDIGNVAGYRFGRRIRGGGYWGVASEEVRDLAAWADFAEHQGFGRFVLVGHSAGWAAVRAYQADRQDPRVAGLVLASGAVSPDPRPPDPQQLADAKRMMAEGNADDLVRIRNRGFPSFISAATFMDIVNTPPEFRDFFGIKTANPGVARIHCPLLAFFGTAGDVGNESELELLKSSIARQRSGPSSVAAVMIHNADHMYTGEEAQVAETITGWAASLLFPSPTNGRVSGKR